MAKVTEEHAHVDAAVLPPMPSLAIDPQRPTCSAVRHTLIHQSNVELALHRHRLTPSRTMRH